MDQEIIGPAPVNFFGSMHSAFWWINTAMLEASFSTPSGSGDDDFVVEFLFAVPFLASKTLGKGESAE